uniref:Uncharacterized protein n=1 Tax=Aegilops tauschii TaxID=37682 RepID=M8BFL9_AEGTA
MGKGVPAVAAFAGGCAVKLRAVCRLVEVRGAAAAMAGAEAARREYTASGAVGLVGRAGCTRDVRGAEGHQACVAGGEGARRVSPES